MEEKEYTIELKVIENNTKYKTLVNYLKGLIDKEAYINSNEIKKILKALEEVE